MMLTCGFLMCGCAKPDKVKDYPSQDPDIFLFAETYYGKGAITSDNLRVYVNLRNKGKLDRVLVLEGAFTVEHVSWFSKNEVKICLSDGISNIYRNIAPLNANGRSENIRIDLEIPCKSER